MQSLTSGVEESEGRDDSSLMLNWIWMAMIAIGIVVAALLGRMAGDDGIVTGMFSMAKAGVMSIILPLSATIMIWLGVMRLAEKAGMIAVLSRWVRPLMVRLFPDVPGDHPAMGAMIMNMSANLLGLGNAATPLGLKAMEGLDSLNPHKGTATNAMCTFLAINTSSVTLIPATAIGFLAAQGMSSPYAIVTTTIGATLCSTIVAVIAVKTLQRLPMFRVVPIDASGSDAADNSTQTESGMEAEVGENLRPLRPWMVATLIGIVAIFIGIVCLEAKPEWRESFQETLGIREVAQALELESDKTLEPDPLEERGWVHGVSVSAIPFVLLFFIVIAAMRGVRVYEEFVEGAKEGFGVAVRILPFVVTMFVALALMRNSGALYLLQEWMRPLLTWLHFPPDLVPMALMRPLSGSGSQAVLAEILTNDGISEVVKYTAATMYGSTETTFYVLAVYFGSVAVRRTRHALLAGLCADATGVIAAVAICQMVFG